MSNSLNREQLVIVSRALPEIPFGKRDDFEKYLADVLRPRQNMSDTDVRHAVAAGLVRYGKPRN